MYYKMKVCIRELKTGRRFKNMYLEKSPPITLDSCLSTSSPEKTKGLFSGEMESYTLWSILWQTLKLEKCQRSPSKGKAPAPQLTGFKPVWRDPDGLPVYPLSHVATASLWNQGDRAQNEARVQGRKRMA